jgi:hypothetical protein
MEVPRVGPLPHAEQKCLHRLRNGYQASARGEGQGLAVAHCSHAVLHNDLCRYDEAVEAATTASAYPWDLTFRNWSLAELVEARVRSGQPEAAMEALKRLAQTTRPCGTDWAL